MRNATALPASRRAATASGGALGRLVADPHAAVEVEQDLVVAADLRTSGTRALSYHRRAMSPPAGPSRLRPLLAVALFVLAWPPAGATNEDEPPAATATTEPPSPAEAAGCEQVEAPKPRRRATCRKPTERLKAGASYVAAMVRRAAATFEITLDAKRAPAHRRLVQVPRRQGLLRRPDLPPHRRRLRHPGRRPAGQRHGRPRLHGRRDAAGRPRLPARASWRWPRPTPSRPGTSGSQFFVVTAEVAQLPPEYALLGKVTEGQDVVDQIGVLPTTRTTSPPSPS